MATGIDPLLKGLLETVGRIQEPKLLLVIAALLVAAILAGCSKNVSSKAVFGFFSLVALTVLLSLWTIPPPKPVPWSQFISETDATIKQVDDLAVLLDDLKTQGNAAQVYTQAPPIQNIGQAHTAAIYVEKTAIAADKMTIKLKGDLSKIRSDMKTASVP